MAPELSRVQSDILERLDAEESISLGHLDQRAASKTAPRVATTGVGDRRVRPGDSRRLPARARRARAIRIRWRRCWSTKSRSWAARAETAGDCCRASNPEDDHACGGHESGRRRRELRRLPPW